MKKCLLTLACLAVATTVFAGRSSYGESYNGASHDSNPSKQRYSGRVSSTDSSVSAKHKELVLKRGWSAMEEELKDAGFKTKDLSTIKKAYFNCCRDRADALTYYDN